MDASLHHWQPSNQRLITDLSQLIGRSLTIGLQFAEVYLHQGKAYNCANKPEDINIGP